MKARCCIPPESVRSGAPARSARRHGRSPAPPPAGPSARSGPKRAANGEPARLHGLADGDRGAARELRALGDVRDTRRAPRPRPGGEPEDPHGAADRGARSPSASRRSVVLPPPFGPAIPRNAPCSTRRRTRPRAPAGHRGTRRRPRRARAPARTALVASERPSAAQRGFPASRGSSPRPRPPRSASAPRAGRASPSPRRPRVRPCRRAQGATSGSVNTVVAPSHAPCPRGSRRSRATARPPARARRGRPARARIAPRGSRTRRGS
jgi:hypothetical protein